MIKFDQKFLLTTRSWESEKNFAWHFFSNNVSLLKNFTLIKIYAAKNFDFVLRKYNPRRDKKQNFFDISKNENILLNFTYSFNFLKYCTVSCQFSNYKRFTRWNT